MDKNAIKKYAIWARNELIAKVSQKAAAYGIEKDNIVDANADSIEGIMLSSVEKKQRKALIEQINEKGYEQVIEEVAYTWFNRLTAIRFMEVNGYLPTHIRVFTDDDNNFKPQILTEAIHLNDVFEKINMEKVFELKQENKTEELYKYLLIIQCNALNDVLPRMFQKIEDYSELLLPDHLLREGSVLEQLVTLIPEEDWQDQVQIIGWLYQYYNSEPKDKVFADLKKNIKITKENIPAATQLFTPDWIVRYMVENSLGRLWLEGHPNDELKSEWQYYLDEAEQEEEVQKQLDEIRKEYAQLKPEDIKCIDPCMGSGHILCYMFDVLVQIYEDYGYTSRDAASSIVEKNLWGLDIDERAAQLSYFAVMMKARQYDKRFLTRGLQPHVYPIEESNSISYTVIQDLGEKISKDDREKAINELNNLINELSNAKEYGSILEISNYDWDLLRRFCVRSNTNDGQFMLDLYGENGVTDKLLRLIDLGEILAKKYHVVVTNPPYMNSNSMDKKMINYLKRNYPDSKSDLFSVFIERCILFSKEKYYVSMITQNSWMYLGSFEKLRDSILKKTIINMNHLGARAFDEISGEVVQTTSFVLFNGYTKKYKGTYVRVIGEIGEANKRELFLSGDSRYFINEEKFTQLPGSPISYWIKDDVIKAFENKKIGDIATPKQGMATTDNNRFLRYWFEVDIDRIGFGKTREEAKISKKKWFPINKGGEFRKWYGNNYFVVDYYNDGEELIETVREKYTRISDPEFVIKNRKYYFLENGTWSAITSGRLSVRHSEVGFIISNAGMAIYEEQDLKYLIGYLNSNIVSDVFMKVINQTLNYNAGDFEKLPIIIDDKKKERITELVDENISLVKEDWDSYELSWDFQKHPLMPEHRCDNKGILIKDCYDKWKRECDERFNALKKNEEELNSIFANMFFLDDKSLVDVNDVDVSIKKADLSRDIRSFISYSVGCMFGRYSITKEGIIFAGSNWNNDNYTDFIPDKDSIIPICDDDYFTDDITNRFIEFVRTVYGVDTLEQNMSFIASVLGKNGTWREKIRTYFLNDFYLDHLKIYQKRPIYWLFDSGKKNGFKCLIYLHRYNKDTVARIRTDYIHELQSRYRTLIKDIERQKDNNSTDKVKNKKKITKIYEQSKELQEYEEIVHHIADKMISIDLDDGVKKNYSIFKEILYKY